MWRSHVYLISLNHSKKENIMIDILKSSFLHKEFIHLGGVVNRVFNLFDNYGSVIVSVQSDSDDENSYTFTFENGNVYVVEIPSFNVFKNSKRIGRIGEQEFIILLNAYTEHKITESGFIHLSAIDLDNGV